MIKKIIATMAVFSLLSVSASVPKNEIKRAIDQFNFSLEVDWDQVNTLVQPCSHCLSAFASGWLVTKWHPFSTGASRFNRPPFKSPCPGPFSGWRRRDDEKRGVLPCVIPNARKAAGRASCLRPLSTGRGREEGALPVCAACTLAGDSRSCRQITPRQRRRLLLLGRYTRYL